LVKSWAVVLKQGTGDAQQTLLTAPQKHLFAS
jgi:hypothetical protein